MKNYKDMADAVFRRRDEYAVALKRKKKIAFNVSLSLCTVCLAVLGAFGIWKTGVLEPDPNVIGTKPQSFTEPTTEGLLHSIGSNATSEGEYTENTQTISGNKVSESTDLTVIVTKPQNGTQATDPVEKPTKPAVKPSLPNLPNLPSLPQLPQLPQLPDLPVIIPTEPPLVTDPVEVPDATGTTSNGGNNSDSNQDLPPTSGNKPTKPIHDTPQSNDPGKPVPPPATAATDSTVPDEVPDWWEEPLYTAVPDEVPDWWEEPTMPGISDETQPPVVATTPCTETPAESLPCAPPTEPMAGNMVEGNVVDQYGNPVSGAVVKVYSQGKVVGSYTTGSTGYYYMSGFRDLGDNYVKVYSVPNGYQPPASNTNISGYYSYVVFVCTKK